MYEYTVGSLGSLISGESGSQSGSRIIFQQVPRARPKSVPSQFSSKDETLPQLKRDGKRPKKYLYDVSPRKRKPEIAGDDKSNTFGKSWRPRNPESKYDNDEIPQENGTFARNAARRVHIKNNTKKNVDDLERGSRTVFVGNIPYAHAHKKKLLKMFSNYGDVESIRFRCVPLSDPRTSKKVAIIKQEFHPKRTSISAYVVFRTEDQAQQALQANGSMYHDHHLRVDLAQKAKNETDPRKCVFIGNLSFETEDEELWELFSPCGKIRNVRIVRDSLTAIAKGIAFVNFETSDAVELALQLNGEKLRKRSISVQRYKSNSTQSSSQASVCKAQHTPKQDKDSHRNNQPANVSNKKKKDKRKKLREKELSGSSITSNEPTSENTSLEQVIHDPSPASNVKAAKMKQKKRLKGNGATVTQKSNSSFMGQKVEKSGKKKKKMTKTDSKMKKIALILTGKNKSKSEVKKV